MTYSNFKLLIGYVESAKGYTTGNGWKAIGYLHLDETPVFNLKNMIDKNQVVFVDNPSGWTGFVITENAPVEYGISAPSIKTYISIDDIQSMSFNFGETNYKEIYTPMKDIFDKTLTLSVAFEHNIYYFENVHDAIMGVKYIIADPCDVTIGVWKTKAERDAATDTTGSIPLNGKGAYYFKAFARGQNNAVATANCTVYIGVEPAVESYQFFTSEGHPFFAVDIKPVYVKID